MSRQHSASLSLLENASSIESWERISRSIFCLASWRSRISWSSATASNIWVWRTVKREIISFTVDGEASSGVDEWDERKVGMDPRKAVTQRDRLGETSKSLEVKEAIWRRSAWALGRGGRSDRRAEEGVEELRSWDCWVCVGGSFAGSVLEGALLGLTYHHLLPYPAQCWIKQYEKTITKLVVIIWKYITNNCNYKYMAKFNQREIMKI